MSTDDSPLRARSELAERQDRITAFLDDRGLNAVWFARPNNFAWLTGRSNVVDRDSPLGVAAAGYDRDQGFRVLTNTIEAPRLRTEMLPDEFTVTAADWYTNSLAEFVAAESSTPGAADFDVPGLDQSGFSTLRQPLASFDIDQYRTLGRETATAVESVCRELTSSQTEQSTAVDVRTALETNGIEAPVVLVGGSERAQQYRHYTPTNAQLGDYALVSVTAQRGGLYASLTRTVAFDSPDWLDERYQAAATVEVSALAATQQAARDGSTAGDVFEQIQQAYDAVGFPNEWTQHHQGGAAGFAGREWIATPTHSARVTEPQGYAWNPTVQGTKSEGTVLVTTDSVEPLTLTDSWPTHSVSAVDAIDADLTVHRPAPQSV